MGGGKTHAQEALADGNPDEVLQREPDMEHGQEDRDRRGNRHDVPPSVEVELGLPEEDGDLDSAQEEEGVIGLRVAVCIACEVILMLRAGI